MKKNSKISLYDTTLRDGTQGEDISLTLEDKLLITQKLDDLGVDYIEAGWPGSNPKDLEYFKKVKKLKLKKAKIVAFGSTAKPNTQSKLGVAEDPNLSALIESKADAITIFGKSWDFHVKSALRISLKKNLELIESSISYLKKQTKKEVLYDAEHFFDAYKDNLDYALKTLHAAADAGADRLILCDTNGGTLPDEITKIISVLKDQFDIPLGIHCHNDSELAVANSLAAIRAGVSQVHGTINGCGERCGNANLVSVIANLKLKLGIDCVSESNLKKLAPLSQLVSELCNLPHPKNLAYVGQSAFAHKGGIHVSAVLKNPSTYEHIEPELVGNKRRVLVSDLSGLSNIKYKMNELGISFENEDARMKKLVAQIKDLENQGYQFEAADASLEILIKKALGQYKTHFQLISFKVTDEKDEKSAAEIELEVDGQREISIAEGIGPVHALDRALRKALGRFYPQIKEVELLDYKVRVLASQSGTQSIVRVLIESGDKHKKWVTLGVSMNLIEASAAALIDSLEYKLMY